MARRLRVLLSAYYFSPYRGGEAAVGWQYATRLAKTHDVTVLFGDLAASLPMKADWERFTQSQAELPAGLTVVHVPPDPMAMRIHDLHCRPGLWFLYYQAYRRWQQSAMRVAHQLHAANPFDLAHQLTIIGYREPGYLWQLGIPFVWGPINGAALTPWRYLPGFGLTGIYRHLSRNLLNLLQMHLPSRSRQAARTARKIWAVTGEDQRMIEHLWGGVAEVMIETGATPCEQPSIRKTAPDQPLRLIWCGLIEDRKALHLVLQAMAYLGEGFRCELHVIGDGPEKPRCEKLAAQLGIAAAVHWHGRVDHAQAQALMATGHVLVHSAIKEGTPHVVLEAMASGLPVICHDACGMGAAVDAASGVKIPMLNPAASIAGFSAAIRRLATQPGWVELLSRGAIARANTLTWDAKVDAVSQAYERIGNPQAC